MNYGPYMKTFVGDINRVKGKYYWLYKKNTNTYHLRWCNGFYKSGFGKLIDKEQYQEYAENNREKKNKREAIYRENNRELIRKKTNIRYKNKKDEIKKYREEKGKNWPSKQKENIRKKQNERYNTDAQYRVISSMRARLRQALKGKKAKKNKTTLEYASSTIQEIYKHLESQFTDGMNWENQGTKPDGTRGWQIDHRRPCCSFDLSNEDEIYMCFHWTNLQPLWAEVNQWEKGGKFDPETFEYEWKGREIGWVEKN